MIRAQILTHPLERKREPHLFECRIDRRRGLDRGLQASQAGIGVFAQPFRVRLGALVGRSHELPGVAEELTVERGAPLEPRVRNQNLAVTLFGAGDVVPGAAGCRPRCGVGVHRVAQLALGRSVLLHHAVIEQRRRVACDAP